MALQADRGLVAPGVVRSSLPARVRAMMSVMRDPSIRSRGRLLMLALSCAVFGILAGAAAWLVLRGRPGWTGRDVASVVVGVAGVVVALVTTFAGPLFVNWLAEKRSGPALPGLTAAQLEAWRAVLR